MDFLWLTITKLTCVIEGIILTAQIGLLLCLDLKDKGLITWKDGVIVIYYNKIFNKKEKDFYQEDRP